MEIPLEVKARREILQKMLEYSSFGGEDIQANLEWLVEDINHIVKALGLQGVSLVTYPIPDKNT